MLQEITERIKALPPLPKSFQQMINICQNPNGTVNELAKLISEDPMLVANLLKLANSPLYGFRCEIKSVLQAVSLFGMATTRSLITTMSVKKLLQVDMLPYGVTPEAFANISGMQSMLAKRWYSKVDPSKVDTLFMAALLQEMGKVLIADEIVKNDEVYPFKGEIESSSNISQVERAYVQTTSSEIAALIFKHWNFDETIVKSIEFSENYDKAPAGIRPYALALKIIKTAIPVNSPLSERSLALATNILEKEGLNKEPFLEAIDKFRAIK